MPRPRHVGNIVSIICLISRIFTDFAKNRRMGTGPSKRVEMGRSSRSFAPWQVFDLVGGIHGAAKRVFAVHPVAQIQQAAALRTKGKGGNVGMGQNVFAQGATKDRAVVADGFGFVGHGTPAGEDTNKPLSRRTTASSTSDPVPNNMRIRMVHPPAPADNSEKILFIFRHFACPF
jgi:hypothetical protein